MDPEKEKLVRVMNEAVEKGLEQVKPLGFLDVWARLSMTTRRRTGYTIVEEARRSRCRS